MKFPDLVATKSPLISVTMNPNLTLKILKVLLPPRKTNELESFFKQEPGYLIQKTIPLLKFLCIQMLSLPLYIYVVGS